MYFLAMIPENRYIIKEMEAIFSIKQIVSEAMSKNITGTFPG
jgi:hypothetical protein